MKKKKLIFGIGLLSCFILLAGCGGNGKEDTKQKKAGTESVSIWTPFTTPSQTVSSWRDSPFHTGLEELSGIPVDWQFPLEGTDSAQAFNLMISEKELPDIICYGLRDDAESYIEDDIIYDLTDLLPEKAPNYWKFLQENPEFDKAMKTDSGKYYGFGFFRETELQASFIGPMVRKDWLDENNLDMPESIEDIETVLQVFNDKYGAKLAYVYDQMDPGFAGAFGAHATSIPKFYITDENKIDFAQSQPEWKEYMAWMNKMYKKGLIDPDIVTLNDEGIQTKVANDKVGMVSAFASRITVFNENSKTRGGSADWVPIIYPNKKDGSPSESIYFDGQVQFPSYVITTSCKGEDLDKALEWLDFAFTEEGSNYWNYGKEGDTWEMKDGKPMFTDKVLKNELGVFEAKTLYTGNRGTGLGVQQLQSTRVTAEENPETDSQGVTWFNGNEAARNRRLSLPLTMTSEESKEAANITNTLDSYVKENSYNFITGDRSLDEFDQFVQELKDQGLDRLIEIKQASYDRYLAR